MSSIWQKLKKKEIILALAPMAGITDNAFRVLCREMGADVVYSEMVSADALYYDSKKTMEMLKIEKKEHPVIVQLFGKRPELFEKAAKIVEKVGADGIDINFGCPAKKVVNHGGGVTLMRNLDLCREIVEAVISAVNVPVSVKIRAGIKTSPNPSLARRGISRITAVDFVRNILDLPVAAIMVHGRTYEQGFSGEVDYGMIKKVVELVKTSPLPPPQRRGNSRTSPQPKDGHSNPSHSTIAQGRLLVRSGSGGIVVLANGGIKNPEDAKKMLDETGADGLGIARGVYGKPWIFRDITEYLKCKKFSLPKLKPQPGPPIPPNRRTGAGEGISIGEIKKIALRHAELAYNAKGDHGIVEMRKHLVWYTKGWENAKELREKLVRVENIKDIEQSFDIWTSYSKIVFHK